MALLAAACTFGGSPADPPRPSDLAPRAISKASPIASCGGASQLVDAPEEPSLAVDPHDQRHLVAAWQQDRRPAGAAYGAAVAVSRDGGATWKESMLPHLSRCAGGGPYELVSDTWASIGPDGTAYVGALAISPRGNRADSAVVVSASRDGGVTWAAPVVVATVAAGQALLDKPSIRADPARPGGVSAVWARFLPGQSPNQVGFARSDDHGVTWTAPAAIYDAGTETQFSTLLAPGDGSLLEVFAEGRPLSVNRPARVAAIRSTDGGVTWSAPVAVGSLTATQTVDPDGGGRIRSFGEAVSAAAGGGRVYATWFENREGGTSTVWASGSADAGRTWSAPSAVVQQSAQAFLPTIAVAGDGGVGVTWYDLRNESSGPGLGTEVWTAVSADHGRTWRERRLDGPFDLRTAPTSPGEGLFVGDYEGLVGLRAGFASAYVRTPAGGAANRTEIAFARFGTTGRVG